VAQMSGGLYAIGMILCGIAPDRDSLDTRCCIILRRKCEGPRLGGDGMEAQPRKVGDREGWHGRIFAVAAEWDFKGLRRGDK
jgi:hypothetical protein